MARDPNRRPTHPGAILGGDVLPDLGLNVSAAAEALGVSRQILHRIIAGEAPVTTPMAIRLGKLCGNGPDLWINMQKKVELWDAAREMAAEIEKIPTMRAHAA